MVLETSIFLIKTNYICHTLHTLLNKLTKSTCFWFFCNQICYHVTSFYNRIHLNYNFLKNILLRWHLFSTLLSSKHILRYAMNFSSMLSYIMFFPKCNPWKQTQFPYKLSIVPYYLSQQKKYCCSFSLNILLSSTSFISLRFYFLFFIFF